MNSRCVGRFKITDIDSHLREAQAAMCGLVIVRAEMVYHGHAIEYTAIGDCFEALEEGAVIPLYLPILHYDGMGGVEIKAWQKT